MSSTTTIVISPDGTMTKFRRRSKDFKKSLRKYLEVENMTFPTYNTASLDLLALYLAGLNYSILLIDNDEKYLYLGEALTIFQKEWFEKSRKKLNKCYLEIKTLEDSTVGAYHSYFENNKLIDNIIMSKDSIDVSKVKKKVR